MATPKIPNNRRSYRPTASRCYHFSVEIVTRYQRCRLRDLPRAAVLCAPKSCAKSPETAIISSPHFYVIFIHSSAMRRRSYSPCPPGAIVMAISLICRLSSISQISGINAFSYATFAPSNSCITARTKLSPVKSLFLRKARNTESTR